MRKIERNNTLTKAEAEKPKKEFKIEIVKIGKLEDNTGHKPNSRNSQNTNTTNSYF